jgi:hypothetical protein
MNEDAGHDVTDEQIFRERINTTGKSEDTRRIFEYQCSPWDLDYSA